MMVDDNNIIETDVTPHIIISVKNENLLETDTTPKVDYSVKNENLLETDTTPKVDYSVKDNIQLKVVVGYYENGKFNDITSTVVKTEQDPAQCLSICAEVNDDSKNVEVNVYLVNRATAAKTEVIKLTNDSTVNSKFANVGGGIGIYSKNSPEFDNLTIEYKK